MAPSAVETTTTEVQPELKPNSFNVHLTSYKEIDSTRVNKDVEEGKTGERAAQVNTHPCSLSASTDETSILITYPRGTQSKIIPH